MDQRTRLIHNALACDAVQGSQRRRLFGGAHGVRRLSASHRQRRGQQPVLAPQHAAFCAYGGSSGGKPYSNQTRGIVFTNNVFSRGPNGKCAAYGAVTDFNAGLPGNRWRTTAGTTVRRSPRTKPASTDGGPSLARRLTAGVVVLGDAAELQTSLSGCSTSVTGRAVLAGGQVVIADGRLQPWVKSWVHAVSESTPPGTCMVIGARSARSGRGRRSHEPPLGC